MSDWSDVPCKSLRSCRKGPVRSVSTTSTSQRIVCIQMSRYSLGKAQLLTSSNSSMSFTVHTITFFPSRCASRTNLAPP